MSPLQLQRFPEHAQHSQYRFQCYPSALPVVPVQPNKHFLVHPNPVLPWAESPNSQNSHKNDISILPLPLLTGEHRGSQDQAPSSEFHSLPREGREEGVSGGIWVSDPRPLTLWSVPRTLDSPEGE